MCRITSSLLTEMRTTKGTLQAVEGYPRIEKNGLGVLLNMLGPSAQDNDGNATTDTVPDPIFVAVDFENTHEFRGALTPDLNFQVGLAILDTRDLHEARRQCVPPNDFVKTFSFKSFNFVCGSSEYFSRASRRFQFGVSVKIQQADMLDFINSAIIAQSHDQEQRAIVLVGHGLASDCRVLSQLGFDFQRVVACVDSFQVCGQVLPYFSLRLYELLDELRCPYGMLHNGGNDAMFALRALLLLTAKHLRSGPGHRQSEESDMADYLETIGRLPLPDKPAAMTSGHC